jgi:hypothetical protein
MKGDPASPEDSHIQLSVCQKDLTKKSYRVEGR